MCDFRPYYTTLAPFVNPTVCRERIYAFRKNGMDKTIPYDSKKAVIDRSRPFVTIYTFSLHSCITSSAVTAMENTWRLIRLAAVV